MPLSSAACMAPMDSSSSWAPHEKAHPAPPMAHAPMPSGVMLRSLFPSCRVCMKPRYLTRLILILHDVQRLREVTAGAMQRQLHLHIVVSMRGVENAPVMQFTGAEPQYLCLSAFINSEGGLRRFQNGSGLAVPV